MTHTPQREGWAGWETFEHSFGGERLASDDARHWAHHGLAVTASGAIVAPLPAEGLAVLDASGAVLRVIAVDATSIHGVTAVTDPDGTEAVWVADCGFEVVADADGTYAPRLPRGRAGARAFKVELARGVELCALAPPHHDAYEGQLFLPTSVVEDEIGRGGSGDVWVADGYGAGLVHRYDHAGNHLATLDGTDGAGRFDCPHNLLIDRRGVEPALLVADRGNARLQTHDLAGSFLNVIGDGVLTSPSALAVLGSHLVVAELNARIVVLDAEGNQAQEIGADADVVARPGWPNALDELDRLVRPALLPRHFNSPHGLAVGPEGELYVSEWLIGGRLSRVDLLPAAAG